MMNNTDAGKQPLWHQKAIVITRNILILIILNSLNIFATSNYSLITRFDLKLKNTTLETVFDEIKKNSEFSIIFKSEDVNLKEIISIEVEQQTVEEILNQILRNQRLSYEIKDKHIIIFSESSINTIRQQSGKIIVGKVVDTQNEPIIGANVTEVGTINGTTTDSEGNFSLTVQANAVIRVTYIGYLNSELEVDGSSVYTIVLKEDNKALEEVVVIGYGTQRRADVTSSVVSIKAEDFTVGKIQDASELIKGKIAGLSVVKSSGDPNEQSTLLLRGVSTLRGNTAPLILVDGVPGSLNTVAPENIEAIDVLKDASAAAIYGTRGATGVILITTKSGRREQMTTVNYSAYLSTSDYYKEAKFMTAEDTRAGRTSFADLGHETDWVKAIKQTGFTHNHSLSISGGNKTTSYSGDFTYRNENGIIKKTNSEDMKMTFDLTHYVFNDIIRINLGIVKGLHRNNMSDASTAGIVNPYRQAIIHNPTAPIYDENGNYYEDFNIYQYYNPVGILNEKLGEKKEEWTRLKGNLTVEPIKGWKTNLMLATQRSFYDSDYYASGSYYSNAVAGYDNSAQKYSFNYRNEHLELTSTYETKINKHRLTASYLCLEEKLGRLLTNVVFLYNNRGRVERYKQPDTSNDIVTKEFLLPFIFQ